MSSKAKASKIVAVLNSTQDVIELLQQCLEDEGFNVVGGLIPQFKRGHRNLVTFIEEHDPTLIVYDLPPPYEGNLHFLEMVKNMKVMEGRKFLYTTTNKEALLRIAEKKIDAIEIIGKPMDLEELIQAVKKALKD